MEKLLPILLLSITSTLCFSQKYREMIADPTVNFYDIQKEANTYFATHGKGKGSGYKQYKRWEYHTEDRVFPSGDRSKVTSDYTFNAFRTYNVGKSTNKSLQVTSDWQELGPASWSYSGSWNPGVGRVNSILVDPTDTSIIYVATPTGGLWKSTNSGQNWASLTGNLPVPGCSDIAIDPTNPNILYLATGDRDASDASSDGVYKSTDGGTTWTQTSLVYSLTGSKIYKIATHPTLTKIVFASTTMGFFKSLDGGVTWVKKSTKAFVDFEFHPANPDRMYGVTNIFYISTNGGETFAFGSTGTPPSNTVERISIAVTPAASDYVYYLFSKVDGLFGGVYKSTDSGVNFIQQSSMASVGNLFGYSSAGDDSSSQAWYDMALSVSPNDGNKIYIAGIICFRSDDGGYNFTSLTEWYYPNSSGYNHADVHYLYPVEDKIYSGSDGGIYVSYNDGVNWSDLSVGLGIRQFYRMSQSLVSPTMVMGGAQDNGTSYFHSGWLDWLGGDGMDCEMDYTDSMIFYGSSQNGYFCRTYDGGYSSDCSISPWEEGSWVTPLTIDPSNPSVLYAGYYQLWKTADRMDNWEIISSFDYDVYIREIAVAPSNSNYIYVVRGTSLFSTTDGGTVWDEISGILPNSAIEYVAVHPANADRIAVCFSGYSATNKVFESFDRGTTWKNITGTLPAIPANCVAYDDNGADGIYVAMDIGVYYRDITLMNWVPFLTNLPNIEVTELKINAPFGKIRACTYGRGIWETDLAVPTVYNLDGGISSIVSPASNSCDSSISPVFTLTNFGLDTLSFAKITYSMDGNSFEYYWSGILLQGETDTISLSSVSVLPGDYSIIVHLDSVNNTSDEFGANDQQIYSFSIFSNVQDQVTLTLYFDDYPEETSWELVDMVTGLTISSGSNYDHNFISPYTEDFQLESHCYEFRIHDLYSDGICCTYGEGHYSLMDGCNTLLVESTGEFQYDEIMPFCLDFTTGNDQNKRYGNGVVIYPNPCGDEFTIFSGGSESDVIEITMVDLLGKNQQRINRKSSGQNHATYSCADMSNGVYVVQIKRGQQVNMEKLVINR